MALSDAAEDHNTYVEASRCLLAAVKETGSAVGGVVEYNDSHARDEVLAVYDRAIELALYEPASLVYELTLLAA